MKKGLKGLVLLVALLLAFSPVSQAEMINCGKRDLKKVMIQGDRDDGHPHENSLVIMLNDSSCNGRPYLYMKNDHPAFMGMVSIALTAKAKSEPLEVLVNTSNVIGSATEISILINDN